MSDRDFALARLAEARGRLAFLESTLDEVVAYFIDPSDDPRKRERREMVEAMIDEAGMLSRTLEAIQDNGFTFKDVDPDDDEEEAGAEADEEGEDAGRRED